jgi:eukaryotic-like serine/threonine-protein kinase
MASRLLRDDKKAMRDFRQEAMSIACLDHDGIINVYDFGLSANQQPYLVMEYFQGPTLKDVLENEQRLSLPRFCSIFSEICNAMQSAHEHNVVHCDIKPANIQTVAEVGALIAALTPPQTQIVSG